MKKRVKAFEDFIGDLSVKRLRNEVEDGEKKDGSEVFLDPDMEDPSREYDQEDDGSDALNQSPLIG